MSLRGTIREVFELGAQTHILSLADATAIYHSLTHEVIFLRSGLVEHSGTSVHYTGDASAGKKLASLLKAHGFCSDDGALLRRTKEIADTSVPSIQALVLCLTGQCNLKCDYCVVKDNMTDELGSQQMPPDVLREALDFASVLEGTISKLTIVLWGGEPLVAWDLVIESVETVRQRFGDHASIIAITNGVLLDEKRVRFLVENGVFTIVSLDGMSFSANIHRFGRDQALYERVVENCRLLRDAGVDFGLSAVLVRRDWTTTVEDIVTMCRELRPVSIGIGPLHAGPMREDVPREAAADALWQCFLELRRLGIVVEHAWRRVRPFVHRRIRHRDCPAAGGMLKVLPSGDICCCDNFGWHGEFLLGNIKDTNIDHVLASEVMKTWAGLSQFARPSCYQCLALGVCGGGCPYDAFSTGGSLRGLDEQTCVVSRKFLRNLLELLWEECKNSSTWSTEQEYVVPDKKQREALLGDAALNPFSLGETFGEFACERVK